jgi:hypothetical protein
MCDVYRGVTCNCPVVGSRYSDGSRMGTSSANWSYNQHPKYLEISSMLHKHCPPQTNIGHCRPNLVARTTTAMAVTTVITLARTATVLGVTAVTADKLMAWSPGPGLAPLIFIIIFGGAGLYKHKTGIDIAIPPVGGTVESAPPNAGTVSPVAAGSYRGGLPRRT